MICFLFPASVILNLGEAPPTTPATGNTFTQSPCPPSHPPVTPCCCPVNLPGCNHFEGFDLVATGMFFCLAKTGGKKIYGNEKTMGGGTHEIFVM